MRVIQFAIEEHWDAAPDAVFSAMTDAASFGEWMPGFEGVEFLTQGEYGLGTEFRESRRMFRRTSTEHFQVTTYDPPRELELTINGAGGTSGSGSYRFRYRFEPIGAGTEMTIDCELGVSNRLIAIFSRLMLGSLKRAIRKDHKALATHLARQ